MPTPTTAINCKVNCRFFLCVQCFFVVMLVNGRPERDLSSIDFLFARKRANQLYTYFLLTQSYPYTCTNISWVFVIVLLDFKQNSILNRWSVDFRPTRLGTLPWNECNNPALEASRKHRQKTGLCQYIPTHARDYIHPLNTKIFDHSQIFLDTWRIYIYIHNYTDTWQFLP